jgi:phosphate transport system permease protein
MNQNYRRWMIQVDRAATWIIKGSGLLVMASMVAIFIFLMVVAWPLLRDTSIRPSSSHPYSALAEVPLELGLFGAADGFYTISSQGNIDWNVERESQRVHHGSGDLVRCIRLGPHRYNLIWSGGLLSHIQLFPPTHRSPLPRVVAVDFAMPPGFEKAVYGVVRILGENRARGVFLSQALDLRSQDYYFSETEQSVVAKDLEHRMIGNIQAMALGEQGRWLYVSSDQRELAVWDLDSDAETSLHRTLPNALSGSATHLAMIYGDFSVAVGSVDGGLETWGVTPREKGFQLSNLHQLDSVSGKVEQVIASGHDKSLLTISEAGDLALDYTTSEKRLLHFVDRDQGVWVRAALAEDNSKLMAMNDQGQVFVWLLDVAYPQVSLKTLWRPVWYEGYAKPTFTWQSSAAADFFEPKISLPPLVFGSLKGTFYSMLFALPISLLAAMYVSHLMDPRWRSVIKPIVELMAGLPSVIVGFIAALVLAPILERNLLGVFVVLPLFFIFLGASLLLLTPLRDRLSGREFLVLLPMGLVSVLLAFQLGSFIEVRFFESHFDLWLFESFGLVVQQRNALVIAVALGFAVMPLIFTIAEDALYNVPRQYTAASLALGGSRWQTLCHVVLPIAKPGILAAVMIGLGRAVGETMIVLMATGNTPVMTMDLFEGMRTLSANIAIEIGEAPVDSMLFRVLFLSALLLFAITFVINTVAELIRSRLQQKYRKM